MNESTIQVETGGDLIIREQSKDKAFTNTLLVNPKMFVMACMPGVHKVLQDAIKKDEE